MTHTQAAQPLTYRSKFYSLERSSRIYQLNFNSSNASYLLLLRSIFFTPIIYSYIGVQNVVLLYFYFFGLALQSV